jgi:hypothetical protein
MFSAISQAYILIMEEKGFIPDAVRRFNGQQEKSSIVFDF